MDRREFFRKSLSYLTQAAGVLLLPGIKSLGKNNSSDFPDLVAVRDGMPDKMFDKAIAALGGMERFVKKNQKVLVKPNIGFSLPPDRAANTNPLLVKRIVEHCLKAGASKVFVFDNTTSHWEECYKISGIGPAVKEGGGILVPGHKESYYQQVSIPGALSLKKTKIHELYLESDVIINVPILKHHGSVDLTIAIKNLMGVVWDRWYYHSNNLPQCIADFCLYRKPTLNVVDAYAVVMRNGPRGNSTKDVDIKKMLLVSKDIVAIDAAAAKIFGKDPGKVAYIKKAHDFKLGTMNLEQIKIEKFSI
jgi:uncharacterized protein (DUF362 family)